MFDRAGPDGYYDIWVMKPDGTGERALTHRARGLPRKHIGNPSWHPSGRYIVFQAQKQRTPRRVDEAATPGAGVPNDLWLMTSDGRRFWKLRDLPLVTSKDAPAILHPHFSRDGRKLCWSERLSGDGGVFGEWVLRVASFVIDDGGPRIRHVTTYRPGRRASFYETHGFSVDGSRVLFTGDQDGGLDIYTIHTTTRQVDRLTRSPRTWDEHAHYSPDGDWIVWMSSRGLTFSTHPFELETDYWLMRPDGSARRRITSFNRTGHPHFRGRPVVAADSAWGPEGRRLVALLLDRTGRDPRRGQGEIVMIELDGR